MDGELAALASTSATTMVGLLTTDAWERVKSAMTALWGRTQPERADRIGDELDEARAHLLRLGGSPPDSGAAGRGTDAERDLAQALVEEWQGRLRRLLLSDPQLADELRRLLDDEFRPPNDAPPGPGNPGGVGRVEMRADVSGGGRVYQAGRDQHITESGRS